MMIIRDAKVEEFPTIRSQRLNAYQRYIELLPEGHWLGLKQAISSEADEQDGVEVIVAEIDGNVVGSVALFPAKTDAYEGYLDELDYPEIRMLAVSPEHQGKGVASALVSECIQRSTAKGFRAIGLHTGDFMEPAQKLYAKMGFERFPEYDFQPLDDGIIVRAYRRTLAVQA